MPLYARVVELADSLDSGSSVHYGRAGSSPASRTMFHRRAPFRWNTPRGFQGSTTSYRYARVVELADSLDSGSSVHYGRAGSSPASRTKKKDTLSACLSFWVLRAVGPTPLRRFKCSAEVNSASAKVLPAAKHPHGALVPPARRPVGWSTHTFSGFQNTNMNAPSKEKDIRIGCPSLSFCPPEAAQAASLLWRNFLDKRGRTL